MKKILIVAPAWLGDLIMAQSLLKLLKQREPDSIIDILAPAWNFAILHCMSEVHQAIPLDITHGQIAMKARYLLAKQLHKAHYDQAYILPNSFKSALIPFLARIPKRTGWLGEMRLGLLNDVRKLDKLKYPLMVQRFAALAFEKKEAWDKNAYPRPQFKLDISLVKATLQRFDLLNAYEGSAQAPIIALCPGAAFGETKRWPSRYFAEIAREMNTKGWQVWLFGSPKDREVIEEIQAASQSIGLNLGGRLQLNETVDLLSCCSLVLSNDSGLLHVAAALDIPLVGIYGSTSPNFTPPLSNKAVTLSVDNLSCRPCFERHCRFGHLKCLHDLQPERVMHALTQGMCMK